MMASLIVGIHQIKLHPSWPPHLIMYIPVAGAPVAAAGAARGRGVSGSRTEHAPRGIMRTPAAAVWDRSPHHTMAV